MSLTKVSYSLVNGAPVNVLDYGSSKDLGVLINAAVADGAVDIYIPEATDWVWNTVVTLPELWRGRIWSDMSKSLTSSIILGTGNEKPCIDAQGALFVEIIGLNASASQTNTALLPACFIVFARMPSGASSSNHKMTDNLIGGAFKYCIVYNVGGEELVFLKNYWSISNNAFSVNYRTACIVHTLNEESYFSNIVTKAARTNGTSTSAIQHIGDVAKNFNTGGSALYIGPNVNDVTFDLTYGTTPANSFFLSLGGYFDGIRLGVERVETDKTSPIVYAATNNDAGLIDIYKGAYRRSGAANASFPAIYINGLSTNVISINVSPNVTWASTFAGGTEDVYLLNSGRKTTCNVSFLNGGQVGTLLGTIVVINTLVNSYIAMGKSTNLGVTTQYGANQFWFFGELPNTQPSFVFKNGASFDGAATFVTAVQGSYPSIVSSINVATSGEHIDFLNPNGQVGSIVTNGTATAYNTASDYRLKKNPINLESSGKFIDALQPKTWEWVTDGTKGVGFIAHEVQAVSPSTVTGEKDAVNDKGEPVMQSMEYGSAEFIANIIAELKSLRKRVAELEAKGA